MTTPFLAWKPDELTTPAARNKNPGNLKDKNTGGWRSFSSPQEGYDALIEDIKAKQTGNTSTGMNGDTSLIDFFRSYAPDSDKNDPISYAKTVAKAMGVDTSAKIGSLRAEDLAPHIAHVEDNKYFDTVKDSVTTKYKSQPADNPFLTDTSHNPFLETKTPDWRDNVEEGIRSPLALKGSMGYGVDVSSSHIAQGGVQLLGDVFHAISHPLDSFNSVVNAIPSAFNSAGQAITSAQNDPLEATKDVALFAPKMAWGIIKGFFVDPVSSEIGKEFDPFGHAKWMSDLSEEERVQKGKEFTANVAFAYLGGVVGKSLASNPTNLYKIVGAKDASEAVGALAHADIPLLESLYTKSQQVGIGQLFKDGMKVGAVYGAGTGFAQGNTPEERIHNSILSGITNGLIGGMLHTGFGFSGIAKANEVGQAARIVSNFKQIQALEPLVAARTMTDIASGVDVFNATVNHLPKGSSVILHDVPKESVTLNDEIRTSRFNGKVLIDNNDSNLSDADHESFSKNGFIVDQKVQHKGKDYAIRSIENGIAEIQNIKTGKSTKVGLDKIAADGITKVSPIAQSIPIADVGLLGKVKETSDANESEGLLHEYTLPKSYDRSIPKYTNRNIKFASDFDRAAYMTSEKSQIFRDEIKTKYNLTDADLAIHKLRLINEVKRVALEDKSGGDIVINSLPYKQIDPAAFADVLTKDPTAKPSIPIITSKLIAQSKDLNTSFTELMKDAEKNFTPEELDVINANKNRQKLEESQKISDLLNHTSNNGMFVQTLGGGKLGIYNSETKKIMGRFDSYKDALEFTRNAGPIISSEIIPLGDAPLVNQPPSNMLEIPPDRARPLATSWAGKMLQQVTNRDLRTLNLRAVTSPKNLFVAMENTFKFPFYSKFYVESQRAVMQYKAAVHRMTPVMQEVESYIDKVDRNRSHLHFEGMETMSPEEIQPSYLSRPMTENEVRISQELSTVDPADRSQAFDYVAAVRDMRKGFDPIKEYASLSDDGKKYAKVLLDARGRDAEFNKNSPATTGATFSIEAVRKLADAIQNGSLSREEFFKKHSFSPNEKNFVSSLDKFFDQFANEYGIAKERRLKGYISHMRNYGDMVGPMGESLAPDKFSALFTRTGENDNILNDPFEITHRYANQGLRYKYLTDVEKQINSTMEGDQFEKMVGGAKPAEMARRYVGRYLAESFGSQQVEASIVTSALNKGYEAMGIKQPPATTDIIKLFNRVGSFTYTSFRPAMGIRDFTTVAQNYFVRFGAERTRKLLSYANESARSGEMLRNSADIPMPRGPLLWETIDESYDANGLGSLIKQGASKLDKAGLDVTLQPKVFDLVHKMVFIESYKTIVDNAALLEAKKITQKQFESRIHLSSYDEPAQKQFRETYNSAGPSYAAKQLAHATGEEQVGYFQNGNIPYLMMNKYGKLLGQFGTWPAWMMQNYGRMVTQGDGAYKAGVASRIGLVMGATTALGSLTGTNLSNYGGSGPFGVLWAGSPATQQAQNMTKWINAIQSGSPMASYFGSQIEPPIPLFLKSWNEAYNQAQNGAPPNVIGSLLLGLPLDRQQYPKP